MSEFELFIGYLGNGATVCNKAVMESGDYKTVAHISPAGHIKLYVDSKYIPKEDMDKINAVATRHRQEMESELDRELVDDYCFSRILDECCDYTAYEDWHKLLNSLHGKNREEKIKLVKEYYLKHF